MNDRISMRKMEELDRQQVFEMMKVFYHSPAVLENVPDEVLMTDISDCVSDFPFVEGFILLYNGETAGYSMIAKGYSTEFGCLCIWIEDLYLKEGYRCRGIGKAFFGMLEEIYKNQKVRFRLEAEAENEHAVHVYRKMGYRIIPYMELSKETALKTE